MKRLTALLLCLPLLTGCGALREPTDMFVIAGTALAWREGSYLLASEMGDTGSTKEDLPSSWVFSGAGATVSAALFDLASRAEREIFFGKNEVLLLEETMPAQQRRQALELFLAHRSDGDVLLCALRAHSPEAALSFGKEEDLRTSVIMGLLQDGERRAACRTVRAKTVRELGDGPYCLPEITVDDRGPALTGAAFYVAGTYRGRMEGQPVRLLCLLLGSRIESACSFHGPDWAIWLQDAALDRSGTILQLRLDVAFTEGHPTAREAELYLEQMGDALLADLQALHCDLLGLPDFQSTDYRLQVTVHMP